MRTLPLDMARYLHSLWSKHYLASAYLHVDTHGCLTDCGGDYYRYGLRNLERGQNASEQIAFLEGLLPYGDDEPLVIPLLTSPSGRPVNVHIVPSHNGSWVLFFAADEEYEQRLKLQQKSNELALLYHQQKQCIEDLLKKQQELEIKQNQAEQSDRLKRQFIASMSRELRVPLASILGYARYLTTHQRRPREVAQSARSIQADANHLLTLIDTVLDLLSGARR